MGLFHKIFAVKYFRGKALLYNLKEFKMRVLESISYLKNAVFEMFYKVPRK